MSRRGALLGLAILAVLGAAPASGAPAAGKVFRIGYLSAAGPTASPQAVEAFRQALRDVGYVEGQNLAVEYRWAEGRADRFPALAADLVNRKVDLLFVLSTPGALAAKGATRTIPIVFAAAGEPVGTGIVTSLARPGANVTGVANVFVEISGKVLQLMKEAAPGVTRVAVLGVGGNPAIGLGLKEIEAAGRSLKVQVQYVEVRGADGLAGVFREIGRERADGLIVFPDTLLFVHRAAIVEFAARKRLPAMYPAREFAEAGGLMSYGANFPDLYRRVAVYVDKILKGAKPGDLPVEQPTRFELVVNLKAARALGLTLPRSILIQADDVIQ
jgi:putative ABC transport system substrate-binding protein